MKKYLNRIILSYLLHASRVFASKPNFTIKVQDGTASGLEGLDPSVAWKSSASVKDFDFQFGTDVAIRATTDLASLPRRFWGKVSRNVAGWDVSADANVEAKDLSTTYLKLAGNSADYDFGFKVSGKSSGSSLSISNLEVVKGLDVSGAKISVNPRYNLVTSKPDVILTYNKANTGVYLAASRNVQKVTVSQTVSESSVISPTVSSSGAISVNWLLRVNKDNTITTTVTPHDSVKVLWKDGPWKTSISAPLSGFHIGDVTVGVKRDLGF